MKCPDCGLETKANLMFHIDSGECFSALKGYRVACLEIIGGFVNVIKEMLDEFNKDYKCPHCPDTMRAGEFDAHLAKWHPDVTFGHDKT